MRILALACWLVAAAAPWLWPSPAEKAGKFFALGHWWNRALELQVPLIIAGCVLTAWGWQRALAAERRPRRNLVL